MDVTTGHGNECHRGWAERERMGHSDGPSRGEKEKRCLWSVEGLSKDGLGGVLA